jgi:uncharacterized protein
MRFGRLLKKNQYFLLMVNEALIVNVTHGLYFVNLGVMPSEYRRTWESCFKYGFISAGQNTDSSNQIRELIKGDIVVAYLSRKALPNFPKVNGYVAIGIVENKAVPINNFLNNGKTIRNLGYVKQSLFKNCENENGEWLVGVKWIKKVPNAVDFPLKREFINQTIFPKWRTQTPPLFANQLIKASILNQPATITFLKSEFGVKFIFMSS